MFSTITCIALFLGMLFASFALWAFFLRLGLRWAKVPNITTRGVVISTAIVIVLQFVLNILFLNISLPSNKLPLFLAELPIAVIVPCLVIMWVFKVSFLRGFQAWLPTLFSSAAVIAFSLFVLRPFLFEAFVVPTNAMAPTLLGNHWKSVCAKCGQPNYRSPIPDRSVSEDRRQLICENFHVTNDPNVDKQVFSADRFLVAKFLAPKRWDLVVFQYPEDPSILYVKRLVGLPGEKIHIEDGAVWANDEKLSPPDYLQDIQYLSEIPWYPMVWGSKDHPAVLGEDEYFVLGDFSAESKDSRLWERGAPGHNPFAVPESHLKGVVTHIFWPLQRLRILR